MLNLATNGMKDKPFKLDNHIKTCIIYQYVFAGMGNYFVYRGTTSELCCKIVIYTT